MLQVLDLVDFVRVEIESAQVLAILQAAYFLRRNSKMAVVSHSSGLFGQGHLGGRSSYCQLALGDPKLFQVDTSVQSADGVELLSNHFELFEIGKPVHVTNGGKAVEEHLDGPDTFVVLGLSQRIRVNSIHEALERQRSKEIGTIRVDVYQYR